MVARFGKLGRTMLSHSENLDDILVRTGNMPGQIVASVRDPVERFRSAFDMYRANGQTGTMTLEEFQARGPGEWLRPDWGSAFWRQTYWLRDIEHVRRWGVLCLNTATLDEQMDELKAKGWDLLESHQHHKARTRSKAVDPTGIVRDYYADDYALLQALGYRTPWSP